MRQAKHREGEFCGAWLVFISYQHRGYNYAKCHAYAIDGLRCIYARKVYLGIPSQFNCGPENLLGFPHYPPSTPSHVYALPALRCIHVSFSACQFEHLRKVYWTLGLQLGIFVISCS